LDGLGLPVKILQPILILRPRAGLQLLILVLNLLMIVKNNISKTWKILELEVAAQMELFVRKTSASYSPPFPKIPVSAR